MPCLSISEPSKTGGQRICLPPEAAAEDQAEGGRSGSGLGLGLGLGSGSGFDFSSNSPRLLKEPARSESSSIGKNSDEEEEEEEGDNEVQSPLKGSFKVSMDSLEEALPMRRGISSFYNGKSRSFASLADASSSSSIKAIVKPESPYSRRRRNNLACNLLSENNHHKNTKTPFFIRPHSGAISKKPASFASSSSPSNGRSTLALAVAMANTAASKTHPNVFNDQMTGLKLRGLGPSPLSRLHDGDDCASPLSLRGTCHWRSFSLADLQNFGATMAGSQSMCLGGSLLGEVKTMIGL